MVTAELIHAHATQGWYYSPQRDEWKQVNIIERIVRAIFCFVLDSTEIACKRWSWKAVAQSEHVPYRLTENMTKHLYDSLKPKSPYYVIADALDELFRKSEGQNHFQVVSNWNKKVYEIKDDENNTTGKIVRQTNNIWNFTQDNQVGHVSFDNEFIDASSTRTVNSIVKVMMDGKSLPVYHFTNSEISYEIGKTSDHSARVVFKKDDDVIAVARITQTFFQHRITVDYTDSLYNSFIPPPFLGSRSGMPRSVF